MTRVELLNVPISEDRDSKFGIVFKHLPGSTFNPEQTKDFGDKNVTKRNPKFGRMPLIF
jgi:hypothetical protein